MAALSTQDIKDYLGIDFTDAMTDRVIESTKAFVEAYMAGALGAGYPREDERIKAVEKLLAADFFDNREINDKQQNAKRRLLDSSLLQLRMEMRSQVNGGEGS